MDSIRCKSNIHENIERNTFIDVYKRQVVSRDSKRLTMIHTFNMHDTLNKPSENKVSEITVPIVELRCV